MDEKSFQREAALWTLFSQPEIGFGFGRFLWPHQISNNSSSLWKETEEAD